MKVVELKETSKDSFGRVNLIGSHLEACEYETILHLTRFGFDIEILRPTNTPGSNNPDIQMLGTTWEIKTLETSNKKTVKKRLHKASLQSSHIVFDLRRINKQHKSEIQKNIIERFTSKSSLRRMILILDDSNSLDIIK